ncbi:MAG: cupin domain-containing protein [Gammaproteobacteria bacterium]|nr:cupin domain-containing protein [Gammaproteobacteria bacterium]
MPHPENTFTFDPTTTIKLNRDGTIAIQNSDEAVTFSKKDKPTFRNDTTGETVLEYSGAVVDQRMDRSWAHAYFDPQGFSPLHYHNDRFEIYYIIKGKAEVTLDGDAHFLTPGEFILIHPKQKHQVKSVDVTDPLEMIVKCFPSWIYQDQHLI